MSAWFVGPFDTRGAEVLRGAFHRATSLCRELSFRFHQAVTEVEHAEWLMTQNGSDEAQELLTEAHQTFEELENPGSNGRHGACDLVPRPKP